MLTKKLCGLNQLVAIHDKFKDVSFVVTEDLISQFGYSGDTSTQKRRVKELLKAQSIDYHEVRLNQTKTVWYEVRFDDFLKAIKCRNKIFAIQLEELKDEIREYLGYAKEEEKQEEYIIPEEGKQFVNYIKEHHPDFAHDLVQPWFTQLWLPLTLLSNNGDVGMRSRIPILECGNASINTITITKDFLQFMGFEGNVYVQQNHFKRLLIDNDIEFIELDHTQLHSFIRERELKKRKGL